MTLDFLRKEGQVRQGRGVRATQTAEYDQVFDIGLGGDQGVNHHLAIVVNKHSRLTFRRKPLAVYKRARGRDVFFIDGLQPDRERSPLRCILKNWMVLEDWFGV